jgi:saccharopine dehydrogenase-like NADP-dependent oxidoreductase
MKHILLFGAGKSATVLIDYLKNISVSHQWKVTVADYEFSLAQSKVGEHPFVKAEQINILEEKARKVLIESSDIVISMLPPALHYLVAIDCIQYKKHLLTASYVDDEIRKEELKIKNSDILFLYEMGLDPGIDHMSAMNLIDQIKNKGGRIISFKSHCGGLIAPESDNNPWRYKISWNPRNVVLAGKAGAIFRESNIIKTVPYEQLFSNCKDIKIDGLGTLSYYPNRDSLSYIPVYGLEEAETFVRTTLRYPEFCEGWKQMVDWKLTEEEKIYNTTDLSIAGFFKQYFEKNDLANAVPLILSNKLVKAQFEYLGLNDNKTLINKGLCSSAIILQFLLETKLALHSADKDLIVMLHEIDYSINGHLSNSHSLLVIEGENQLHTAMAKSVGLPLGIAAQLILEGKIKETGLHIPILSSIYEHVLDELKKQGIEFKESGDK